MKHYILYTVALTTLAMPAMAQETYESANIATQDLNGTARYVGMGGAMEALGADISTINSNPAGIGLFRKSSVSMSLGPSFVKGDCANASDLLYIKNSKTPMSFDQFGLVLSNKTNRGDYVNIGINYNKSRNFNQILSAESDVRGASQNKVLYHKTGGLLSNYKEQHYTQSDYLYVNTLSSEIGSTDLYYNDAEHMYFAQDTKGYISNFNINVSGNHNDRVFWGFTLGLYDVNYSHNQVYSEDLVEYATGGPTPAGIVTLSDERKITGQGFDLKAGIIFRPIETSPLRVGFSIATPTFYELTSSNYTEILNEAYTIDPDDGMKYPVGTHNYLEENAPFYISDEYDYKVFTPWRFGASLGYTIGKNIALGASYEFADYSSIDNRYITNRTYNDYYGYDETDSESDNRMNNHTERTLRGVSTLKLGAEYKPTANLSLRAGYNYVSQMYEDNGMRNLGLDTDGCYFSSTTNYVNWKATNRFTLGAGYTFDNFNIDVAYQHSSQKGDFYPFETVDRMVNGDTNIAPCVEVNNNRHQFLLTIGYKFNFDL